MYPRNSVSIFAAVLVLSASLSMSSAAQAAVEPEASVDSDEAAKKGKKGDVSTYVFDDDSIAGEVMRPEGANIASRGKNKAASLITIRPHFLEELIKLADDI